MYDDDDNNNDNDDDVSCFDAKRNINLVMSKHCLAWYAVHLVDEVDLPT